MIQNEGGEDVVTLLEKAARHDQLMQTVRTVGTAAAASVAFLGIFGLGVVRPVMERKHAEEERNKHSAVLAAHVAQIEQVEKRASANLALVDSDPNKACSAADALRRDSRPGDEPLVHAGEDKLFTVISSPVVSQKRDQWHAIALCLARLQTAEGQTQTPGQ